MEFISDYSFVVKGGAVVVQIYSLRDKAWKYVTPLYFKYMCRFKEEAANE
jgi:hypothetical protein